MNTHWPILSSTSIDQCSDEYRCRGLPTVTYVARLKPEAHHAKVRRGHITPEGPSRQGEKRSYHARRFITPR
jgi:hypothetical protein